MSYQVIARRWRSKNFSELVGQEAITQTLTNAMKCNRLPHAILLTGPRGTGKTSTARILAKSIRCSRAVDFVACNVCEECVDIDQSRSVDVIEIDGASNNGVDAVRELRESVAFRPAHGQKKFYIIDEVHMLTSSAFNALLKTLEEPPEHVLFVMATTEVHKIPNTILSRCQRFDFRRIPTRQIADHLEFICSTDSIRANKESLWLLAKQGDGSMRDAQSLLDQVVSYTSEPLTLALVTEALGLTDRALINGFLESVVERNPKKVLLHLRKFLESGHDPKIFMDEMLQQIRNLLIVKLQPEETSALVDLPDAEIQALQSLGQNLGSEEIHLLFDLALKAASDLGRHQNPLLVLEVVLLRMATAPRIQNLLSLKAPDIEKSRPSSSIVDKRPPSDSYADRVNDQNSLGRKTTEVSRWSEFVEKVKKVNGLMGAQLENVFLQSLEGMVVTLGAPEKLQFVRAKLDDTDFQKKILNYLNTFWGPGYSLKIASENETKENLPPKKVEELQQAQDEESTRLRVENHPLVKATQNVFKSQIRSIKETQ